LGDFFEAAVNRGHRERLLPDIIAAGRYQQTLAERPWFADWVSQQDLPAFIGATPVLPSRLRRREDIWPPMATGRLKRSRPLGESRSSLAVKQAILLLPRKSAYSAGRPAATTK
jgi:hypothetical protein